MLWWWSSAVNDNAGLCGDLVSVGSSVSPRPLGTSYTIDGTNLGNVCIPCCDKLRENPIFCCMEARQPEFALSTCEPSC